MKSITPNTDAISQELLRVVADLLDSIYTETTTSSDGRFISGKRTNKWIKIKIARRKTQ